MGTWILLAAPLLAVGAGRHRLLMLRGRAGAAWSQLDAQLSRRHERIQALLDEMDKMAGNESETTGLAGSLQQVRDAHGIPARAEAENELSGALRRLRGSGEMEIRSDHRRIQSLSEVLSSMEAHTALAARCYNQQVMAWNQALHRFPWSLIARLCRYRPIEYFVFDDPNLLPEPFTAGGSQDQREFPSQTPERPNA